MKNLLFPRLRQAPWLYGIGLGIPLLILLRLINAWVWSALMPSSGLRGTVQLHYFGVLALHSVFMGGVLGGLTINLLVEWWNNDRGRLRTFTCYAAGNVLLVIAWKAYQLISNFLSMSTFTFSLSALIPGPQFIPWQVRWGVLLLMNDVPLLWAVTLVVMGILFLRRLTYEEKRMRQFEPSTPLQEHSPLT